MPEPERAAHEFAAVADIEPLVLMEGLRVRPVSGERITLAVFELDPGIAMPEHTRARQDVTIVESFSPPRDDWADKPRTQPSSDRWPPL
jgi:quercetin dioxygenase-like cupin family protein